MIRVNLYIVLILLLLHNCKQNKGIKKSKSNQAPPTNQFKNKKKDLIDGISIVATKDSLNPSRIDDLIHMNAEWVAYSPYAYCSRKQIEIIYNSKWQWFGEKTTGTNHSLDLIQKKGLKVMLKPQLWIGHGEYTGNFKLNNQQEWKKWQDSYQEYIMQFAKIAEGKKVEIFCIGTELKEAIKYDSTFWNDLITKVKKIYSGKLTYAANWDDYREVPFWEDLDYVGVDAYFPLSDKKMEDKNILIENWEKWKNDMKVISEKVKKPILFTEVGYRDSDYTTKEPWSENNKTPNQEAQKIAFEALFEAMQSEEYFAGMFIWKWFMDKVEWNEVKADFTPQKKLAEQTIKDFYK